MTDPVDALPVVGEQHVVVGELRGAQGRKSFTAPPSTTPRAALSRAPSTSGSRSTRRQFS